MNLGDAILVLLAVAVALQLLLWRVQRAGLRQLREHSQRLAQLERRFAPCENGAVHAIPERAAPPRQALAADPLQQAIGLARAGRSFQEIAASCGISEAEAKLLVRMRGAPM